MFFATLVFLTSCLKDDKLSLNRMDNLSQKLRLDGYYLGKNFTLNPFFLYENGVLIKFTSRELKDSLKIEDDMVNIDNLRLVKSLKFHWGVYVLNGNSIMIQRWYPSEKPYRVFTSKGTILNDTTFVLTETLNGKENINEIYRFVKFSPKPDSTNSFID